MAFSVFQCPGNTRQDMLQPNHKLYNSKARLTRLLLVFDVSLYVRLVKGEMHIHSILQLSSYFKEAGDYALSKDVDVALWLDSREYHGEPPLTSLIDFVIVNCQLHDHFDAFKKVAIRQFYSHVNTVELLRFYCHTKCPDLLRSATVQKFGKCYLHLRSDQIDDLVEWVLHMRERHRIEGRSIFDGASQMMVQFHDECKG